MIIKGTSGGSAYSNAFLGIRKGVASLRESALQVASANGSPTQDKSLNRALIDARSAAQQVDASAKTLSRADKALGEFIDTLV